MTFLIAAIGGVLLIMALNRLATFFAIRRLRLRGPRFRLVAAEEVPPALCGELETALASLAPTGFVPAGWTAGSGPDVGDDRVQWSILALHPEGALLVLSPALLPEPGLAWQATFFSPLADGRILASMVGGEHLVFGSLPQTAMAGSSSLDPLAAWPEHRTVRNRLGAGDATGDGPEAWIARLDTRWSGYPDHLVANRLAVRAGAAVRPALAAAWRCTGARLRGTATLQRRLFAHRRHGNAGPVPAAVEVDAILRADARRDGPGDNGLRGLAMLVGAGLFLVISGALAAHWWHALVILAVLLVHEGGHLLAMRLCGYRDTAVFVLPGLGAFTTGEKRDASPTQQAIVTLAGPLPGVIAGTALLLHGIHGEVAVFTVLTLLILNLFNLLPLLPLDGGQLVHRLLLARWPWADAALRTLAVGVLAVLAWQLDAGILLAAMVLLAFALPGQWREAGFARACLRDPELAERDRAGVLAAIATRASADARIAARPCLQRWAIIRGATERVLHRPPRWWLRLGLLLLWAAGLFGPAALLLLRLAHRL